METGVQADLTNTTEGNISQRLTDFIEHSKYIFKIIVNYKSLSCLEAVAIASQIQALHVAQHTQQQNRPLPRYPQTLTELLDSNQSQIFVMQVCFLF